MSSVPTPPLAAGSVARRHRILAGAMRLFATLPYAEVHIDAIAAAAQVAKPTLYRYFPTKEALFVEGLEWSLGEMHAALAAVRAAEPDHVARLTRAVAIVLDGTGALSPAIHVFEGQGSDFGERSRRILRRGFAALQGDLGLILADGIDAGAFTPCDTELATLMILGTVRMAAFVPRRAAPSAAALAALFLDGLRVAPARPLTSAAPGSEAAPTPFGAAA